MKHRNCGRYDMKEDQKMRFKKYSLGVWGTTIIICLISLFSQFTPIIPAMHHRPSIGETSCFFQGKTFE